MSTPIETAAEALLEHRDNIARVMYEAIPDPDRTWEHLDEWSRNAYRKQADAVLAYLLARSTG